MVLLTNFVMFDMFLGVGWLCIVINRWKITGSNVTDELK